MTTLLARPWPPGLKPFITSSRRGMARVKNDFTSTRRNAGGHLPRASRKQGRLHRTTNPWVQQPASEVCLPWRIGCACVSGRRITRNGRYRSRADAAFTLSFCIRRRSGTHTCGAWAISRRGWFAGSAGAGIFPCGRTTLQRADLPMMRRTSRERGGGSHESLPAMSSSPPFILAGRKC
jgi:hypothetical protein